MTQADYRYIFRGNAVAVSGHIRRPKDMPIVSQAPAVVGVTGGVSRGDARDANFGDILRFASASSEVVADFQEPTTAVDFTHGNHAQNKLPTRTTVSTSVEGITMVNADARTRRTLTVGKIAAQLVSEWPGSNRQTSVRIPAVAINVLKLDEFELEVTFHNKLFSELDTRYKLARAYQGSDDFFKKFGHLFFFPAGKAARLNLLRKMPQAAGVTMCTIVESIHWKGAPNPNAEIRGNSVVYRDFGTMYLGELLVSDFERRLTMMRIQLGSPEGGDVCFVETQTNGVGYPP
jgi:hypothetical protein